MAFSLRLSRARIERGEITRPRKATVRALEATLGLSLDEIASF